MAAFTPEEFKARSSPVFDAIDDADVQTALDIAACTVSETNWGVGKYPQGIYFLAAHFLTTEYLLKNAGSIAETVNVLPQTIQSEKIKSWSASYSSAGQNAFSSEALGTTQWGSFNPLPRR